MLGMGWFSNTRFYVTDHGGKNKYEETTKKNSKYGKSDKKVPSDNKWNRQFSNLQKLPFSQLCFQK